MQHLLIGGYVISAVFGLISTYHLLTQYKIHNRLFLRTYGLHVLMLNLVVISLTVAGYVNVNKEFVDRMPRTLYKLTQKGRSAIKKYKENMLQILDELLE